MNGANSAGKRQDFLMTNDRRYGIFEEPAAKRTVLTNLSGGLLPYLIGCINKSIFISYTLEWRN